VHLGEIARHLNTDGVRTFARQPPVVVVDSARRSRPLASAELHQEVLERHELADRRLDGASLETDDEPDLSYESRRTAQIASIAGSWGTSLSVPVFAPMNGTAVSFYDGIPAAVQRPHR
jgi:hypothetical protein